MPSFDNPKEIVGYVYCPPEWNRIRLSTGEDANKITAIANITETDIYFQVSKNALRIVGDCNTSVFKAQVHLNSLFETLNLKPKSQWARPQKPLNCQWGERRDLRRSKSII